MHKHRRKKGQPPTTIKQWEALNSWTSRSHTEGEITSKILPRVILVNGVPYLDIREHRSSQNFKGFTPRGLRLRLADVVMLESFLPEVKNLLTEQLYGANQDATETPAKAS